ncbi:D-alanine--D-alanine ligase [Eubacteriales bacterium OttesenSCG-928-G02]|nr:D-alanine--D-alanine ligase [Eubacteriales bacterium OttesenSCG-928-G02]
MKKSVLILFGGASTEHEISCVSAAFVADNIDTEKYDVYKIGITKSGVWYLFNGTTESMRNNKWQDEADNLKAAVVSPCSVHHGIMVLDKLKKTYEIIHIDIVFPVLHGKNGEDGTMQGLLSIAGIPFVGCDTYSSAVCMDKIATKLLCEERGIKTAPFIYSKKEADYDINRTVCEAEESFDYPMIVKPANAGSSIGVTKAKTRAELVYAIETAFANDRKILIEKVIKGREIEVAVFGNESIYASTCGEIDPQNDFYDYETKYISDSAKYFIPARTDDATSEKIKKAAEKVYKTLDCKGLSRVDFFLTEDGQIILNEINTIPGFTSISMYPRLMQYDGRKAAELIEGLLELALEEN